MRDPAVLEEAISFGPKDYNSVLDDPLFRVGFEVEFVGVFKKVAENLPKSSISLAYVLRDTQLFLNLFDVDLSSVLPLMNAWINQTAHVNQGRLSASSELKSIAAAERLYGSAAVRHLGSNKTELIDAWQRHNWTTPEGRISLQREMLGQVWTPAVWLEELGHSIHNVSLKSIWPQLVAEPKFGWADNSHTYLFKDPEQKLTRSRTENIVVKQLNDLELSSRVGFNPSRQNYEFSYDGSINADHRGSGEGFELISPPMSTSLALSDLRKIFDWISSNGHYTNDSTGFHVGVSYGSPDSIKKVNKLKLVMLLGEDYLLQLFDRELNTYTQSHLLKLKKRIADAILKGQDWTKQRRFNDLLNKIEKKIDVSKYTTVNFKKLEQGYLEFRIMGNENYHEKFETVKDTILRYAFVLRAALDPHSFETTYKRELARLFSQSLEAAHPEYPDLVTKYAVMASSKPSTHLKNLDLFVRAQRAFEQGNVKVGVKITSILINQADQLADTQTPNLINAAALSYRIFLKRHGLNIAQFAKQMRMANVKPEVIKNTTHYLRTY